MGIYMGYSRTLGIILSRQAVLVHKANEHPQPVVYGLSSVCLTISWRNGSDQRPFAFYLL